MTKRIHIRLNAGGRRFNYRIAGLGFRDGHVLVHRAVHEPFWTFPGGRAEIGETSEETLKREMVEELGVEVTVHRLLWIVENFFHYEQRDWHELGFYYLMDIPPEFPSGRARSSIGSRTTTTISNSNGCRQRAMP